MVECGQRQTSLQTAPRCADTGPLALMEAICGTGGGQRLALVKAPTRPGAESRGAITAGGGTGGDEAG